MSASSKSTAAAYLSLVFLAGTAFGVAVDQFYSARAARAAEESGFPTAAAYRRDLVETLDSQLHLDDDQAAEILTVLEDIGDRWYAVRDAMEPEFEAIRQERTSRILAVLNPDQRLGYQRILDERQRKNEEKRRAYREGER